MIGDDEAYNRALLDAHAILEHDWAGIVAAVELEHAREIDKLRDWVPAATVPPGTVELSADQIDRHLAPCARHKSGTRYYDALADHRLGRCTCAGARPRPTHAALRRQHDQDKRGRRYGEAALAREGEAVAGALVGVRNEQLNRSAWSLARLVLEEIVDAGEVEDVLVGAALDAGLHRSEAVSTVRGALRRRGAL